MEKTSKNGKAGLIASCLLAAVLALGLCPALAYAEGGASSADAKTMADIAPGTYTVTANLVVPGEYNTVLKGIDAYPTNPDNPLNATDDDPNNGGTGLATTRMCAPTMGVENNATLTVASDGTKTLVLNIPNPVFTIQSIDGCDTATATVTKTQTGTYGTAAALAKTSRISQLTFTLQDIDLVETTDKVRDPENLADTTATKMIDELQGKYLFSSCSEYPTILNMAWTVPLELRVDFSNVKYLESVDAPTAATGLTYTGSEQTAVTAATGYTVSGGSATNAGTHTATATLASGYKWSDGTKAAKEIQYTIAPLTLTASYGAQTVSYGAELPSAVSVTGFVNGESASTAAGYVAPVASLPTSVEPGKTYDVAVSGGSATNYTFTYQAGTLSVTYAGTVAVPTATEGLTYTGSAQTGVAVTEGSHVTLGGTTSATNVGTYTATATPETGYTWADGSTDVKEISWSIAKAKVAQPSTPQGLTYDGSEKAPFAENAAYTITGEAKATNAGDYTAVFTLTSTDNYEWAGSDAASIEVAWSIAKAKIAKPTAATGLTENGSEQTGVAAGDGYTLSGDVKATAAGSYKAVATLDENHTWADGSTDAVTIEWSIAKASDSKGDGGSDDKGSSDKGNTGDNGSGDKGTADDQKKSDDQSKSENGTASNTQAKLAQTGDVSGFAFMGAVGIALIAAGAVVLARRAVRKGSSF